MELHEALRRPRSHRAWRPGWTPVLPRPQARSSAALASGAGQSSGWYMTAARAPWEPGLRQEDMRLLRGLLLAAALNLELGEARGHGHLLPSSPHLLKACPSDLGHH